MTLCLFIGAVGKSAQIPLYVWLPDAMAGPTPVSALIHAATMVTAGVYMVVRSNVLFQLARAPRLLVAVVGCGDGALRRHHRPGADRHQEGAGLLDRVAAGLHVSGGGVGAYSAAIFHLGTHAFFKALLFLGSGSVIHAMSGEQDMRKMGGLKRKARCHDLRTFLIGTLAIAGIPPLAGFFLQGPDPGGGVRRAVTRCCGRRSDDGGLTACYMFRCVFMTFYGSSAAARSSARTCTSRRR